MPPVAKKVQPKAAPKAAPEDVKNDDPQEPVAPAEPAAPDGPAEQAGQPAQSEAGAAAPELANAGGDGLAEPELIAVMDPCPKCYPEGWFEGAAAGTVAGCRHAKVPFGEGLVMTKEQAREMGYGPREEQ